MAKQRPKAKGSRARASTDDAKPNLFERLYNRKKFDILGKKAKGERKHGQSVHDAVEKVTASDHSASLISVSAIAGSFCT